MQLVAYIKENEYAESKEDTYTERIEMRTPFT